MLVAVLVLHFPRSLRTPETVWSVWMAGWSFVDCLVGNTVQWRKVVRGVFRGERGAPGTMAQRDSCIRALQKSCDGTTAVGGPLVCAFTSRKTALYPRRLGSLYMRITIIGNYTLSLLRRFEPSHYDIPTTMANLEVVSIQEASGDRLYSVATRG